MIVQGERSRPRFISSGDTPGSSGPKAPDPDEVRARILLIAEEHFRRIGHHKTSVADIATELGMSRANVHRFSPCRDAINESICRRVVSEVADIAIAIPQACDSNSQTRELRTMRYELTDYEWTAIKPMLPNKPRGVARVNDRGESTKEAMAYVEKGRAKGKVVVKVR